MVHLSSSRLAREFEDTDAATRAAGHEGPIHVRPAYGRNLVDVPRYLAAHDRSTITWDVEPDSDTAVAADPDRIVEHVLDETRRGSNILLLVVDDANAPARAAPRGSSTGCTSRATPP